MSSESDYYQNLEFSKVARSFKNLSNYTLWGTVLNLGPAWLADVCAAKTKKYLNKPAKGYERIIQRF